MIILIHICYIYANIYIVIYELHSNQNLIDIHTQKRNESKHNIQNRHQTGGVAMVGGPHTAMKSGPHLPQLEKALAQKRRPNTAINK